MNKVEQKVVITTDHNTINSLLSENWRIISTTAQHVSVGGTSGYVEKGSFCFVLEREIV